MGQSMAHKKVTHPKRVQLIDSILLSIMTYWSLMFPFQKGVLPIINRVWRGFIWNSSIDLIRIALVAWLAMCIPREEGWVSRINPLE